MEKGQSIKNKVVIVTGASSGIGLAMTEALLVDGYDVIAIAKDFSSFKVEHDRLRIEELDVSALDNLAQASNDILKSINKPIKALVNNAGLGKMAFLEQLSIADMRMVMDINFMSHAIITKVFLPTLKRQGQADIVFTGSEAALKGARQGSIYCASKFAIRGFAQSLREECGKSRVRVTLINPGAVRTPFFDDLHFEPGADSENAIEASDIADILLTVLNSRPQTVFDEINLSPLNHVWKRK
jgi:3-hydroxy acid dehydrogenase/malonic semialdehyde reductase